MLVQKQKNSAGLLLTGSSLPIQTKTVCLTLLKRIGTKPYDADTDGDFRPDGYEYLTLITNPLKFDTYDNGVSNYDEDFDNDGLFKQ